MTFWTPLHYRPGSALRDNDEREVDAAHSLVRRFHMWRAMHMPCFARSAALWLGAFAYFAAGLSTAFSTMSAWVGALRVMTA